MGLIWKRSGTSAVVVGKASGSTLTGGEAASSSNVYDWLEVEQDTTRSGSGTTSSEYSIRVLNVRKFAVGWGDGQGDELISLFDATYAPVHTYASPGTYSVRYLLKQYPGQTTTLGLQYAAAQNSGAKHTDVKRWGGANLDYESIVYYISSSAVTTLTATDLPPSVCTNWLGAFRLAPAFAGGNLANWTHIPFAGTEYMLGGTIFNEDISGWNMTAHVADLDSMFDSDSAWNQDISSWSFPTPSGTRTMQAVFNDCDAFNQPLAGWNTSKTTTFYRCFFGCALFNQDLGSWDVSSATTISGMFQSTNAFNNGGVSTVGTGLDTWNVSNVTDFSSMFRSAAAFNSYLGSWTLTTDPAKDVNMSLMFLGCGVLNQDFSGWNTERVTSMALLFRACNVFNNNGVGGVGAGLDSWDTSSVTSINQIFWQSGAFNQTVGSWNMSSCTTFSLAFSAASFNNGGVGGIGVGMDTWDVSAGTTFEEMFRSSAFDQYIGSWSFRPSDSTGTNSSVVTNKLVDSLANFTADGITTAFYVQNTTTKENANVTAVAATELTLNKDIFTSGGDGYIVFYPITFNRMFQSTSFNQNISGWDVQRVTVISSFTGAAFVQDLSSWDVSNCRDLSYLGGLQTTNYSNWNPINCSNFAHMFANNTVFNSNIGNWDLRNASGMTYMMSGAISLTDANVENILVGWNNNVNTATGVNATELFGNRTMNQTTYAAGKTAYDNLALAVGSGGKGWNLTNAITWV
jgi:surface protein